MGRYQPVEGLKRRSHSGFTYPIMLIMVSITAIMAVATQRYTSALLQREKEQELLFRGDQYVSAIESYYQAGNQYPTDLDDLVQDPRFLNKKHLRKRYKEPFAKEGQGWHIIRNESGGIIGVASSSTIKPFKNANFPARYRRFIGANQYSEWVFEFRPDPGLRFKEGRENRVSGIPQVSKE